MPKRILIVDDEPNIVLSLEFLMKKNGYDVETATDGEQALTAVDRHRPDLVLLDVMMPRKDGYQVCQILRENADYADMRIVMLTAKGRDVEREKGLSLGADDYITKPFSTQDVVDKVGELLGDRS
ncbi:response regulator transcription factor [Aquisalimonas asiatica]|uniref:Response regulator receiver protein n=1 Tax=Aquisalimonas asiatica TaxID=406100 RepID=A0A1H8RVU5_9GAMM|nr:response regulator [Aquisalimonas asiatica]SEO70571.1 response regulator receiver protein [Aquisalimonas asiatica]